MPLMDYSKKYDYSSSDDDEPRHGRPRVTKLDGPAQITLGAQQPAPPAGPPSSYTNQRSAASEPRLRPPPRPGLDYSKWDSLGADDSELSDEAEDGYDDDDTDALTPAEQTKLAAIMRDTKAESAESVYPDPPAPDLSPAEQEALAAMSPAERAALASVPSAPHPEPPTAQARFDALRAKLSRNGAVREKYLWRQTESEVELSILLPPDTKARHLQPELFEPNLMKREACPRLAVNKVGAPSDAPPLFNVRLAYRVEQATARVGPDELAWEVTDYEAGAAGRRALRLTFIKENPHGVVVWWTRAIEGEEQVNRDHDVLSISATFTYDGGHFSDRSTRRASPTASAPPRPPRTRRCGRRRRACSRRRLRRARRLSSTRRQTTCRRRRRRRASRRPRRRPSRRPSTAW